MVFHNDVGMPTGSGTHGSAVAAGGRSDACAPRNDIGRRRADPEESEKRANEREKQGAKQRAPLVRVGENRARFIAHAPPPPRNAEPPRPHADRRARARRCARRARTAARGRRTPRPRAAAGRRRRRPRAPSCLRTCSSTRSSSCRTRRTWRAPRRSARRGTPRRAPRCGARGASTSRGAAGCAARGSRTCSRRSPISRARAGVDGTSDLRFDLTRLLAAGALPALRELVLCHVRFADDALRGALRRAAAGAEWRAMHTLELTCAGLRADDARALARAGAQRAFGALRRLDLSGNRIECAGARALARAAARRAFGRVEALGLTQCAIGDEGADALVGALAKHAFPRCVALRFAANPVRADRAGCVRRSCCARWQEARFVLDHLRETSSLSVRGCGWTCASARAFARALEGASALVALRELCVREPGVSDDGCAALARAVGARAAPALRRFALDASACELASTSDALLAAVVAMVGSLNELRLYLLDERSCAFRTTLQPTLLAPCKEARVRLEIALI